MLIHKKNKQTCEWGRHNDSIQVSGQDRKTRSLTEPIRLQNLENSARLQTEKKNIYLSCRRTYYLQERPTVLFIGALSSRADVHGQVSSRRTLLGPGTSLRLMQRFPPYRESKQITELKQQGRFRAVFILQMCVVFFQRDIFSLCLTIFRRNRSSDWPENVQWLQQSDKSKCGTDWRKSFYLKTRGKLFRGIFPIDNILAILCEQENAILCCSPSGNF